jgi:hypothetical protein
MPSPVPREVLYAPTEFLPICSTPPLRHPPFLIHICGDPYAFELCVVCVSVADAQSGLGQRATNRARWVKYNRSQEPYGARAQAAGSLPVQLVIAGRLLGTDLTPTWPTNLTHPVVPQRDDGARGS